MNMTKLILTGNITEYNVNSSELDEVPGCGNDPEVVISDYLWKVIPPILFCFGLTGNILTIIVIQRLGFRRQPTLTFLLCLAVNDSVVLVTGLPRHWINAVFDYDLKTASNANCKLYYFFIYLTMQYSSWILVGVTVERLVKTHFPLRYRSIYSSKKVAIALSITLFILILVNGHFFFTNGINDYTEGDCGSLNADLFYFDEHIFVFIDFTLLSLIPFITMLVCNILLIRILRKVQLNRASMMHNSVLKRTNRFSVRMTKMLVVCTFYFLVATAPISIFFILDTYLLPGYVASHDCRAQANMDLAWSITYLLQFSNYCINFYLYTAMNDRFYKELKAVLCCQPRYTLYKTMSVHVELKDIFLLKLSPFSKRLSIDTSGVAADRPCRHVPTHFPEKYENAAI